MRELLIGKNDGDQRLDRFLRKYLDKAPYSFIQRMIRRKNIELNGQRAKGETIIKEGDRIQLYLADETIDKFRDLEEISQSKHRPSIIYQDKNIILINKDIGVLSHGAEGQAENVVDGLINYLYEKGEYDPAQEKTFVPSICNRLDRNTSGIIIGAKNAPALRTINQAIRENQIRRFYKTIVKGQLEINQAMEGYLVRDRELRKVEVLEAKEDGGKQIRTRIRTLDIAGDYSLLEIELLTGRTHQIRAHLSHLGHPLIGDGKYGDRGLNQVFREKFNLRSQLLDAYRIEFKSMEEPLGYLSKREFTSSTQDIFKTIEESLF